MGKKSICTWPDIMFWLLKKQMPLDKLWIQIKNEYPCVGKKGIVILLQFSTSYLFESEHSVLTIYIKTRNREWLLVVKEKMWVALSNVPPVIKGLCARSQIQVSCWLLNKHTCIYVRYTFHFVLFHTVICLNTFINAIYTAQLNLRYIIWLFV